jgi:sugar phosphate permease
MPSQPTAAGQGSTFSSVSDATVMRKITMRLIPLLFICYIVAYVDRINVGFAKLELREALKVDETVFSSVYGFGAGLFFIGYFLFEVPSNLILHRIGARIWIARILILWGFVSMAFMFINSVTTFYVMRFLLGAAEAGLFPGVILYLTYWYAPNERAKIIALFAMGGVAAGVVGSPISGAILGWKALHGLFGLQAWQWLFFLEALPAIALGAVVLFALPRSPKEAKWLSPVEKEWLSDKLTRSAPAHSELGSHSFAGILKTPLVWTLCLLYFLMNIGGYGYEMWIPTIIQNLSGQGAAKVGLLTAIPYFGAGIAMYLVGRFSDKTGERRGVVAVSAAAAAVCFAIAAYSKNPVVGFAALTFAFMALKCTIAPFWAMTTTFLSGTAAAGGIALINSVGNLGGFFGPYFVGLIKDATGSNVMAILMLGGALLGMAAGSFLVKVKPDGRAYSA